MSNNASTSMSLDEPHPMERSCGVAKGHVDLDASRHEVVQLCGEKGMGLFTFLLSSSVIMPEREDRATVSKLRLCDVALQLGWSPDTVKRYMAVFRALNLVQHYHDHRREVTLHIPLGPYVPLTNFTALDELMEKRQKQQQLALKVKTRYIVRFGDPTRTHSDEMRTGLLELKAILDDEHLEPLKRQRLQIKIADLLVQFAEKTETSSVGDLNSVLNEAAKVGQQREATVLGQGDPNNVREVSPDTKIRDRGDLDDLSGDPKSVSSSMLSLQTKQQGDLNQLLGDTEQHHAIYSPRSPEYLGDSNGNLEDIEQMIASTLTSSDKPLGDSKQEQGDIIPLSTSTDPTSPVAQVPLLGDTNQKSGDLSQPSHLQAIPLGDSKSPVVQKSGDSKVDPSDPYTYNVNYIISNITGNNAIRKRLAELFVGALKEPKTDNGHPTFTKYLRAFNDYTPEVVGRAFLATMYLLHHENWSVKKPGSIFTNQCKVLSGKMPLTNYTLAEVEGWLQAWGDLPYPELIDALAAPPSHPQPEAPAPLITTSRQETLVRHNGSGFFGVPPIRSKRTYGMHYTGLPSGRKEFNITGSALPPEDFDTQKEKRT